MPRMAYGCFEWQPQCFEKSPQLDGIIPASFPRARRPALIPPNCSLSAAETEDLVNTRIQQPPFPNPDPCLIKDIRPESPATSDVDLSLSEASSVYSGSSEATTLRDTSPTSDCDQAADTATFPPALRRRPEQRTAWLKARTQYARDRKLKYLSLNRAKDGAADTMKVEQPNSKPFVFDGPKRKHSTFVKELERKNHLEDHAGTPHISNLHTDDDVSVQLSVEELGVGGEVVAVDVESELLGEPAIDVEDEVVGEPTADTQIYLRYGEQMKTGYMSNGAGIVSYAW
ncbi:hypothetical protein P280DRAFT_236112 [Massarina eburnea CBS 473.64]|uniref:Uncharacterized protein n=1 Tax=Massarina eburnea CBS 473.64 TaxID=1395130 RepID=A0A6A6RHT3_9PLEO|nr:hypothetical protein P280DRAFT_236112 [Massarina eburnea CBS 473.64]